MPDRQDYVTRPQSNGLSPEVTVAGRRGRFNFDWSPESDDRTPFPRYRFETDKGDVYYYQLEKSVQGGRWENAEHARSDYEGYQKMPEKKLLESLRTMWAGDSQIPEAIYGAVTAGVPFDSLRRQILPRYNTWRQLSTVGKTPGFENP